MVDPYEFMSAKADGFIAWAPADAAPFLDYSGRSLRTAEALPAEAPRSFKALPEAERAEVEDGCACYILEAGRRQVGGRYVWHPDYNCLALVLGEPASSVGMPAHRKVQGRLLGDEGDSIPYHYAGWRDRARQGRPGGRAFYI